MPYPASFTSFPGRPARCNFPRVTLPRPLVRLLLFICCFFFLLSRAGAQVPEAASNTKTEVRNRVEQQIQILLAEAKKYPSLRDKLFGPCLNGGGKGESQSEDGFIKMLDLFFDEVRSRVNADIQNLFNLNQNATYFGKSKLKDVLGRVGTETDNKKKEIAKDHRQATGARAARRSFSRNAFAVQLEQICSTPPPPVNTAPKAEAGGPYIITLPVSETTLDGSNSNDQEKNIATYNWKTMSGHAGPAPLSPNQAKTKVAGLQPGEYWYLLTVTDTYGERGYDTAIVIVKPQPPPPPKPPVARVDGNREITLPLSTVRLNGSGTDPNQQGITGYKWAFAGNSRGARIESSTEPSTDITSLKEGVYQLIFTVTNKAGLTGSANATITVRARPNKDPLVSAGDDTTIQLPATAAILNGTVSDPDSDPLKIRWSQIGSGPRAKIDSPGSVNTQVSDLQVGSYTFLLTVSDEHGGRSSDTVIITVVAADKKKPVAKAGADTSLKVNESALLHGKGEDADGTITAYHWTQTGGPKAHIVSPGQAQTQIDSLTEAGDYEFQLEVTDNDGLSGTDKIIIHAAKKESVPAWVWIIIGGVLLGGSTGFFFAWWRKRRKLIAYFLNKEEEALVQKLIPGHDKTEGYVVGHASRARIRELKKKGLALRVLNTETLTVNTPGIVRVYKFSLRKGKYILKSETRDTPGKDFVNVLAGNEASRQAPAFPAYYIITLDAPLIPEFSQRLDAEGMPVVQRIPYNSYIIEVKDQQHLQSLGSERFRFIRMIRPYTAEDTGFTIRSENKPVAAATAVVASMPQLVVDLVMHREEDLEAVRAALREEEVEVLSGYRYILRVSIDRNTELFQRLAANKYIQAIYEHVPPVLHNDVARRLIGIDDPLPDAFYETGDGQTVAVADTGIDKSHQDLQGAIITAVSWGRANGDTSDPHGHGTHVAGTIAGNGAVSGGKIRGMAPGAQLFIQSLLDDKGELCDLQMQLPELLQQAYDQGARIVNISWGAATESYYTFDSVMLDEFVYSHQDMLVIVSAGNEAASRQDSSGRPISGFGTVGSPATTKNGLTVGASNSNRDNGDAESVADFSSRGPCKNDRRIKPDIVAPGTHILSTRSAAAPDRNFESFYQQNEYVFLGGTSMATPVVSGAAAMVREFYSKKKDHRTSSAALVKATLLNGTRRLTGSASMFGSDMIPNNNQGYGMLDMLHTIPNKQNAFALWFADSLTDRSLEVNRAGEARFWRLQVKTKTWLRACLVFTDNPKMGMQSDLNLIISLEGSTTKWLGNAGINKRDQFYANREDDFTNNIEIVRIADAEAGSYRIDVVAENAAPGARTGFALVVTTGDTGSSFAVTSL